MTNNSLPFSNAQLLWELDEHGKQQPRSLAYGDIYFSTADAIGESEHVFLAGNNLKQRWQHQSQTKNNENPFTFIIGECGFGSGLNFLTTCKLWCESMSVTTSKQTNRLHYIACENHPLLKADLQRLHSGWPQLTEFSNLLLEQYIDHTEGLHRLQFSFSMGDITLDLLYGDASKSLEGLYQPFSPRVDAWFLDGFSPKLNPQMWNKTLFQIIAKLSKEESSLSSYSVAGEVRRGLSATGFKVTKIQGYGNKRHMLSAYFSAVSHNQVNQDNTPTLTLTSLPWLTLPQVSVPAAKTVAIIGAGLAGCATALALARRGWQVTLIEQKPQLASMASGNPQGIVHCKISQNLNASARFMLQAYLFALRHYRLLAVEHEFQWQQCGLIQLADDKLSRQRQQEIYRQKLYSSALMRLLSSEEISTVANIELKLPGLYFPNSAWLNPPLLCHAYCQHPAITQQLNTKVITLTKEHRQWTVLTQDMHHGLPSAAGKVDNEITVDAVVIANSLDAENLVQCQHYPLIPSRGQIELYQTSNDQQHTQTILCAKGYVIPAIDGQYSIGGSFTADSRENTYSEADKNKNLNLINGFLPELNANLKQRKALKSKSAIRSSSPDYFPVIGPVEDYQASKEIYAGLRFNARKQIIQAPQYHHGLFVNLAHGAHGLTTTPLAAEYLAALLSKECSPLPNTLMNCIHPLRFLIRSLKKQEK